MWSPAHPLCSVFICLPDAWSCARDSLSAFSLYAYIGIFYLIDKNGYVSVTVYHGTYAVGIRAKFGWEGFIEGDFG